VFLKLGIKMLCLHVIKKKVLEVGVRNFIKKLKAAEVKTASKAMSLKTSTDAEEARSSLEEKVGDEGINALIESVDDAVLKKFCSTLGLEPGARQDMITQIADEVMLTGMESFLNGFAAPLLKSHCQELELDTNGAKKDLVERLMVAIFELEPLNDGDPKSKSKSKKASEKKSAKKAEKSDDESSPSPKKRSSSKKTKKSASSAKRTAWVAPPLDTIKKGKYDNYTALYDNFNLPDLVKYCKQKHLVSSGKKKDVINRILNHMKTGLVEEPKKKKRKEKKSSIFFWQESNKETKNRKKVEKKKKKKKNLLMHKER